MIANEIALHEIHPVLGWRYQHVFRDDYAASGSASGTLSLRLKNITSLPK